MGAEKEARIILKGTKNSIASTAEQAANAAVAAILTVAARMVVVNLQSVSLSLAHSTAPLLPSMPGQIGR